MKRLFALLLVILSCHSVYSQESTIKFTLSNDGKPQIEGAVNETNFTLPLTFDFDEKFKDLPIVFKLEDSGLPCSFKGITFGNAPLTPDGSGHYIFVLNSDGKFSISDAKIFDIKKNFTIWVNNAQIGQVFNLSANKLKGKTVSANSDYSTGYTYYDALELTNANKIKDNLKILALLKNYKIKNANDLSKNVLLNKYFADYYNPNLGNAQGGFDFGSIAKSAGNLDITPLADGLAQFLVQRTGEELNAAFFQKFKEAMTHYPELSTMFPQTTNLISNLASYKMSEVINDLRDAFTQDLNAVTQHFLEFSEKDKSACPSNDKACQDRMDEYQKFFKSNLGLTLLIAVDFADGIRAGKNMHDIVERLGDNPYADNLTGNERDIFLFAGIFSNSLLSKDTTRIWIKYSEIKNMIADKDLTSIYAGLLYQELMNANVQKIGTIDINTIFKNLAVDIKPLYSTLNSINKAADELNNIELKSTGKANFTDYYKFTKGAINVLKCIGDLKVLDPSDLGTIKTENFDSFISIANNSVDLVYNMEQKKYGLAVNNLISLISGIVVDTKIKESKKDAIAKFKKYAGFIATVANLTNAKDVKNAISQIALPVGSSAMKKNMVFSVSLNAYVAPFIGDEIYKGSNVFATGIYAPVGFGFNWGIWKNKSKENPGKHPGSFSLFVPLIDVGAIVAYRFDNSGTTTSESVKIRLGDIFSPGLNAFFGIPNVPLSLGFGGNWLPTLSKFYTNQSPDLRPNGGRIFFTLAVDIPVVHFYNKEPTN